ncbi:MAG TPA: hypothetical protein VMG61_12780 [Usitatibacter sp.]|nr:hypothetical protein [Usitatibacter sp.]
MRAATHLLLLVAILTPLTLRAASSVVPGGGSASASLDFSFVVPRVLQVRELSRPASLDISADDIARGTVTVSGAMLDLLANDPAGYVIRARLVNAVFTAVSIVGLPGPLVATPASATLRMATMVGRPKPAPVPVQYELQLSPDAVPGRYAWPVALTLENP